MSRPSNREIRRRILHVRNARHWHDLHRVHIGWCLWATQELLAQFGARHEQPSAAAFYYAKKHAGEIHHHPRVGDFALWLGGRHGYGHAAPITRVKSGVRVMSTDILGAGSDRSCPIGLINQRWGLRLVGFWTPPALRGPAPHREHHHKH